MYALQHGKHVPLDPSKPKPAVAANAEAKIKHQIFERFGEGVELREGALQTRVMESSDARTAVSSISVSDLIFKQKP